MEGCVFCEIGAGTASAIVVYEDADVVAFLDRSPVRPGHTQIIPRQHFDYFDALPPILGLKILSVAQRLGRRLKEVYPVDRVGFLFTGGDVAHVHAHVIPIHEGTDVTSARYIVNPKGLEWSSSHLTADPADLLRARDAIGRLPAEDERIDR